MRVELASTRSACRELEEARRQEAAAWQQTTTQLHAATTQASMLSSQLDGVRSKLAKEAQETKRLHAELPTLRTDNQRLRAELQEFHILHTSFTASTTPGE
jgi:chromosome segregation ATPase